MEKRQIFYGELAIIGGSKNIVKPESKLIENTPEYQASLVLDTLLNIERLKK